MRNVIPDLIGNLLIWDFEQLYNYQLQFGLYITNAKHSSRQMKNKYERDNSSTEANTHNLHRAFHFNPAAIER